MQRKLPQKNIMRNKATLSLQCTLLQINFTSSLGYLLGNGKISLPSLALPSGGRCRPVSTPDSISAPIFMALVSCHVLIVIAWSLFAANKRLLLCKLWIGYLSKGFARKQFSSSLQVKLIEQCVMMCFWWLCQRRSGGGAIPANNCRSLW